MQEPQWDSPQTRELMQRACFDCHSNESTWPWYSYIAPISWLVQNDVEEGRWRLNFSEWGRGEAETDDMYEVVREEEMPPAIYLLTHPKARLNNQDFQSLLNGIQATFGGQAGD
jgi:mono/diheme cytochrome c family protein